MGQKGIASGTITRGGDSAMKKYMRRAVGSEKLGALLKYELIVTLFAGLPGALGMILRQKTFPALMGHCGRGVAMSRGLTLRCPAGLSIGDGTVIDERVMFDLKSAAARVEIGARNQIMTGATFDTGYEGSIRIGDDSLIGAYSVLTGHGGLKIGANTMIAAHCHIVAGTHRHERTDIPMSRQGLTAKGIVIEDDVWIGSGVKVLDGVRIGRGSIISAGAVVTRDVAPMSIMAGVPARLVRMRGEEAEPPKPAPKKPAARTPEKARRSEVLTPEPADPADWSRNVILARSTNQ